MTRRTRQSTDADIGSSALPRDTSCLVVAESRETTDSLHNYLTSVGIRTRTARDLNETLLCSVKLEIVLLFPDDFAHPALQQFERAISAHQPHALLLLVTSNPLRVRRAMQNCSRALDPIILGKPAFGWTIVDTIRANLIR